MKMREEKEMPKINTYFLKLSLFLIKYGGDVYDRHDFEKINYLSNLIVNDHDYYHETLKCILNQKLVKWQSLERYKHWE